MSSQDSGTPSNQSQTVTSTPEQLDQPYPPSDRPVKSNRQAHEPCGVEETSVTRTHPVGTAEAARPTLPAPSVPVKPTVLRPIAVELYPPRLRIRTLSGLNSSAHSSRPQQEGEALVPSFTSGAPTRLEEHYTAAEACANRARLGAVRAPT